MTRWLLILALAMPLAAQQLCAQTTTPRKHHRFPWGVVIRGVLDTTATAMDVQGTQNCLNANTCHEGNSLMPTGPKFAWSLNMSLTGAQITYDALCTAHHKGWCWLSTGEGIIQHSAGAASGWTK